MAIDKSKNTQILVNFPNILLEEVETYRFTNRFENRNEAIRDLIKKGLKKEQSE